MHFSDLKFKMSDIHKTQTIWGTIDAVPLDFRQADAVMSSAGCVWVTGPRMGHQLVGTLAYMLSFRIF